MLIRERLSWLKISLKQDINASFSHFMPFSHLLVPGTFMWRMRNVALGSVLGAAVCFPLGKETEFVCLL